MIRCRSTCSVSAIKRCVATCSRYVPQGRTRTIWPAPCFAAIASIVRSSVATLTLRAGNDLWWDYEVKPMIRQRTTASTQLIEPFKSEDGPPTGCLHFLRGPHWRRRSDGTEHRQLTYPPMEVAYPLIPPDATNGAGWSSDGNLLAMTVFWDATGDEPNTNAQIFDLRTGKPVSSAARKMLSTLMKVRWAERK